MKVSESVSLVSPKTGRKTPKKIMGGTKTQKQHVFLKRNESDGSLQRNKQHIQAHPSFLQFQVKQTIQMAMKLSRSLSQTSLPKKKTCRAGTIRCSPLSASKLPVKGKLLTYQEQPGVQKPLCAVGWPSIRQCKTCIYIYIYTIKLYTMFFHFQVVACFEVGK